MYAASSSMNSLALAPSGGQQLTLRFHSQPGVFAGQHLHGVLPLPSAHR
jgi:hypothetical protein